MFDRHVVAVMYRFEGAAIHKNKDARLDFNDRYFLVFCLRGNAMYTTGKSFSPRYAEASRRWTASLPIPEA